MAAAGDPGDPESRAALEDLCRAYWYPLYALIRRKGYRPDEAADLTQEYFARLLDTGLLARVDRSKALSVRSFAPTADSSWRTRPSAAGPASAAWDRIAVDRRP